MCYVSAAQPHMEESETSGSDYTYWLHNWRLVSCEGVPQMMADSLFSSSRQMEAIIERMQDEHSGVPVRTVKSFMSKIPSVFTGKCSIWVFLEIPLHQELDQLVSPNQECNLRVITTLT